MNPKWQFQNPTFQKQWESSEQPTLIQPAIDLSSKRETLRSFPLADPVTPWPDTYGVGPLADNEQFLAHEAELDRQDETLPPFIAPPTTSRKKKMVRGIAIVLCVLLAAAIYLTWNASSNQQTAPLIVQPTSTGASATPANDTPTNTNSASSENNTSTIQVYILGAVERPGVYTLSANARVYQLVKKAGGLRPNANMVALNLAATLIDGEEIYVLSLGETPPPNINSNNASPSANGSSTTVTTGPLTNINTATAADMRQNLHVSAATAQKIIDYRTQHGPYTLIAQLLQTISQSIYDHIKDLVTV